MSLLRYHIFQADSEARTSLLATAGTKEDAATTARALTSGGRRIAVMDWANKEVPPELVAVYERRPQQ